MKRSGGHEVVDYDFARLNRARTEHAPDFVKLVDLQGLLGSPVRLRVVGAQVMGMRRGADPDL
ncbi:hypothetical protein [Deinococcus humi]|uniref:Uncharacterized protein n=1 Tax=Deinococcus humi TaxID=662880 RepID=A0A7W8JWI0_9DEIO|nr:hypothetical protein [Deinococcus humi]MBB5363041.1 hypothetical protein [Deinococcus humi]GGO24978.1 hypothetical protein GCM10008949_14440 [Deinococcus humi]